MGDQGEKPLRCFPLTEARWNDFEELFGKNGACGGCWCMFWRLTRKEFEAQKGDANREAMRSLVISGTPPGLLGYHDGRPVGWCAIAPRDDYSALGRSRILKPIDDAPCWSVSCFFVHRRYRGQGVTTDLLRAAIEHVRRAGGRILEGYPLAPEDGRRIAPAFAWHGLAGAFSSAGFVEVARRSPTRPIMRFDVRQGKGRRRTAGGGGNPWRS